MLLSTCLYVKNKCKSSQRLDVSVTSVQGTKSGQPIINLLPALTIALNFVASINKNKKALNN